ncbi:MAG: hypothetical protein C4334_14650 [Pyrinomonas sp.]|uniref:efflux RND transporter periplasmic adaptor subunit n=1 Tax=Pyrinomonas sp. TaxID=2080306 RepID=UPI003327D38A
MDQKVVEQELIESEGIGFDEADRRGEELAQGVIESEAASGGEAASQRSSSKRRRRWLIALLFAVLALVSAVVVWRARERVATAEQGNKAQDGPSPAVALTPDQRAAIATEVVLRRSIAQEISTPGKVAMRRMTPVFSQFSGRLVQLRAEVGDRVRAGQRLGVIDSPDIIGLESDYQQALAALATARTSFELAKRTRERAERLAAVEAIPKRELQQAQADEARAKDDLTRAQAAVTAARERLQSAGMNADEIAQLDSGGRAVSRLVPLVAPIGGVIIERHVGLGQVVQAGAGDPLFMIADLSSVWVNADIYEDQLAYVRVGAPLQIKVAAYPTRLFTARVDQIGSVVDPDKHTIALRCVVANPGELLKPGMFVTVILRAAARAEVLTVPNTAVVVEGERRVVFVEQQPGQFVRREIETGAEQEGQVIVKAGLREGERVVVNGSLLLDAEQRMRS